jgi:Ohr subfamily peroxiredoxin
MKTIYTGIVTTFGGRNGRAVSDDGALDIPLTRPSENAGGANPEQLFGAAYGACFQGAIKLAAKNGGIEIGETEVTAYVSLIQDDDDRFNVAVELRGSIGGLNPAETLDLMKAAHELCPYSNATRGNVEVKLVARDPAKLAT